MESLWAITTVVFPCVKKLIAFCILSSVSASKEDVASSNSIIGLFFKIALAIDNLCFSPPESLTPFSPIKVSYLFGKFSTNERIVKPMEEFLGDEVYHYHSKVIWKKPGDGGFDWHQD